MVIAAALGWGAAASIAISVILAFVFGYALTLRSLLRSGVEPRRALSLSFASDTISIATMEIVDNVFIVLVPGALAAGLTDSLFWWSLLMSLAVAFRGRSPSQPLARPPRPRPRGHSRPAREVAERHAGATQVRPMRNQRISKRPSTSTATS